ncbi:protein CELLULOSE SYNTHASE INTERACTIVE 3 isoform X1 [Amaranthus tricolor]|uniref:protein CELLULOSE SYNTHASE INTERACTIVE 3 isoform X1 n=2 Tax=Amaranthus tricolor TaxID=29722 RepID=UPI002586401A|nr:protein CELLULOSE SYNTHASE INTERACTIVE 3 isoform X1 [Amaranthus tricolor]XP_057533329.1 protein CELLULOSE SYNTHASE INTERACTIVE 3 isoform X1 [Amaranthus tricolor]
MPNLPSTEPIELTSTSRESNGGEQLDEESTMATVARLIEQLHANVSSPHEKELITARLLSIARKNRDARAIIGSHGQAMPLFISILRAGTPGAKVNIAATLSVLCRDEDLRIKVLLGGCIPPLLSLLKSDLVEARKAAAEAIYQVSAGGLADDHVGVKIFVTEGVVPTLWEQLNLKNQQDKVVEGFVTGALRNLCGDRDGYWRTALAGGGVDIIVALLSSDNAASQSNAASLLARLMFYFSDSIPKIIQSGAFKALLQLVGQENEVSVRASAADALQALSLKSDEAKKAVVDAGGVPILIGAIVAPSKEGMQGEFGQAFQRHATVALANICGGMSALIKYLGELAQSPRLAAPVADIIGALAYSLMIFEQKSEIEEEPFNVKKVEEILITLLKPGDNKLVQDRLLEAMSSFYGNVYLTRWIHYAEAKKILTGLITMAALEVQEHLILSLTSLCTDGVDIWIAIKKREGIQLLISLLGLSSEQHQEHAAQLLVILTDEVDDSKWAITAAGGIPPLVQLLEVGSSKAKEDAAHVLWNLCCHSEDIRACVESAGAVPAFLWLLRSGGQKGQEASAKALMKLVRTADTVTINQLLAMLVDESPSLKGHIIRVLGHVLTIASHKELVQRGSLANKALKSLIKVLDCSNEENQECSASVLADLFSSRPEICDSLATDEIIQPCMKLLTSKTQLVATQSARALGALARPTRTKSLNKISCISKGEVRPLIKLAKTSFINAAEAAVAALANLLSDTQIASEALAEDVVSALTRVLGEGTPEGKKNASRAIYQLLKHFPVGTVLKGNSQCRFAVLALVESLKTLDRDEIGAADALEVLSFLARTKQRVNFTNQLWSTLAEVLSSLEPLVHCLAEGPPDIQDRVIIILSRLCGDQPAVLADMLIAESKSITSLAKRTMSSSCLEVKVGGTALLTCAAKEHKKQSMESLSLSGFLRPLISSLVEMIRQNSSCCSLEIKIRTPKAFKRRTSFQEDDESEVPDPASVLGGTTALWLLSIMSSFNEENKCAVMEAGGLEVLAEKLTSYTSKPQAEFEDAEGVWISALLLSILFQDASVVCDPAVVRIMPLLALMLKSDEMIDRFFATQAMASFVSHGNKGIMTIIANSGAVAGLVTLIGYVDADMPNLIALTKEFSLVKNPEQVVLEHLFEIEDVQVGTTARKAIPLLVDLLRPMPDRPSAPSISVQLLTMIADASDANKLIMAEAGALEALAKYLSLGPQDITEASISELLRILFTNSELLRHEAAVNSLSQLIAVLRLGSRTARLSAAKALNELFNAENVRDSESVNQVVQPLVDMLDATSRSEQEAGLLGLFKLTVRDPSKVSLLTDIEGNPLESLCKILSSSTSLELKKKAADLCSILFSIPKMRSTPVATECIQPLISLLKSDTDSAIESGVCAFNKLLDDDQQVEKASVYDVVDLLVSLVSGSNYRIIEASICSLIKLGKDQIPRKLDMVSGGIFDNCLRILPDAPSSVCSSVSELFRILTNSGVIARSSTAPRIVEPLFCVLQRPDFNMWGQHSALQALVNVLEKPQCLTILELTPSQVVEPLVSLLESPSQAIQQLSSELLCHLLAQDHFQQDTTTKGAIIPLVQIAGIANLNLQQTAVKALEKMSLIWPKAIADAGGIFELSKVIIQDDPQPPHSLWESAALVLTNVLHVSVEYYFEVPLVVLVKLLHSSQESTVSMALNALIVQERSDNRSAELMADAQAIDALLDLLRSHQCEEAAGRLLEALFNNVRIREMKVAKYAIAPLSQYLLDPQTRSQSGRLLAALALGDLSQHEGLARASDAVSACRALISLLEEQPTEEMKMVAICALQNFVMRSRTNRRAVAEAGGILVVQEQLLSSNADVSIQAALLIRFLFSNHTLQEYISNELIRSLTAALERELWSSATINEEVLRTINVILTNFPKLHVSEATTLCIPHLVGALKSGDEAAQESVLDTLCLLKHSWSTMPIDTAKSQAIVAAEAIPILQMLMKTCPPSFHERADSLLHCLPGCLTVTINCGHNLKQAMGTTNAFCQLTIGNGPPRQTKVMNHSISPEWKEAFTWAFDVPPKGQKLHIICKSKNTFGKATLGRVTIQIDKVVTEGVYSGLFNLNHDSNKDGSRKLEIEIMWSNRLSHDSM